MTRRPAWHRTGRVLAAAAAAVSVVTASACDRCSGVVGCEDDLHVAATGGMIEQESAEPVGGVELRFRRADGVALDPESAVVTTGDDGRFVFRSTAAEAGTAELDVEVRPPGRPAYDVEGLRLRTHSVRGDATDVGRWLVNPLHALLGQLWMRHDGGPPRLVGGRGARVVFRPTGGEPVEEDSITTFTDDAGRFLLLPTVEGPGPVVGDLTVRHRDLDEPYTIRDLRIESDHVDGPLDLDTVLGIGPSLFYFGEIFIRSAGQRVGASDARVTFRRTGGIPIDPDTFTVETEPWGAFFINPRPSAEGEVVGELILDPGEGRQGDTLTDFRFETFNADTVRLLDRWTFGEQINYAGEVYIRSAGRRIPVEGATVQVRRTGGIAVERDAWTVETNARGAFPIQARTDETGVLEVELEVELEPPRGPVRVEGLELETFAADQMRLAGRWAFGPQINYAATLLDQATGRGIADAEVEFRRTGGIEVRPDTFTVTTESWGGFALQTHTDVDGVLEGELSVLRPGASEPVLISDVELETFRTDEFRFLQYFGI